SGVRIGLERHFEIGYDGPQGAHALDQRRDRVGRHQRRRAAAEEDRDHFAVGCKLRLVLKIGEQGAGPTLVLDCLADMAVEVAIRAFRPAERPVDVDGERFARGPLTPTLSPGGDEGVRLRRPAQRHASTSFSKARARWLIRRFAASSWPKVIWYPS